VWYVFGFHESAVLRPYLPADPLLSLVMPVFNERTTVEKANWPTAVRVDVAIVYVAME
jgi:hypothetical protein